jgi:hypothetical protein
MHERLKKTFYCGVRPYGRSFLYEKNKQIQLKTTVVRLCKEGKFVEEFLYIESVLSIRKTALHNEGGYLCKEESGYQNCLRPHFVYK